MQWTAPSDDGGSTITEYRIEVSTDNNAFTTKVADTGNTNTTATVTGLDHGTQYWFRVTALNADGTSAPSYPWPNATTQADPNPPTTTTVPTTTGTTVPTTASTVPGTGTTMPGSGSTPDVMSISPTRLLDTRPGHSTDDGKHQGTGPLNQQPINIQITGRANIPAGATGAVAVNITATSPTAASYLTAYPAGTTRPSTSNLNFVAGQTGSTSYSVGTSGGSADGRSISRPVKPCHPALSRSANCSA